MDRKIFWVALAALVLPLLLRLAWFFPGFNFPRSIATPDYASLKLPVAPVSTTQVEKIKQLGGVVIVDYAHTNQFQPGEIQTLTDALTYVAHTSNLLQIKRPWPCNLRSQVHISLFHPLSHSVLTISGWSQTLSAAAGGWPFLQMQRVARFCMISQAIRLPTLPM